MKLLTLLILLTSLTSCASFKLSENESAKLLVQVAASEVISDGDACHRSTIALNAVDDAREILDEGILSVIELDDELREILEGTQVNPVTAELLYDIAVQVVTKSLTDSGSVVTDLLPEETEIELRELLDLVESVAVLYQAECA